MSNSSPNVSVEVHPPCRASNSQIASCTVRFQTDAGAIVIHDSRILRNKQGALWFSLPSYSVQSGNRQYEYRPTLELSPDLLQRITFEALRAYNAWHDQQTNETKTQGAGREQSIPSR
jgi:hypothetical protein